MQVLRRYVTGTGVAMCGMLAACTGFRAVPPPVPQDQTGANAPAACFDLGKLEVVDRAYADRLLLTLGDREGLYTLAGGLKPISSDVEDLQIRVGPTIDSIALAKLERQRRVTAALTCGDLGLMVQVFTATQRRRDSSEYRSSSIVVFHRGALREIVRRHQPFFATLGVTPSTPPAELLAAVENAARSPRWRGYGYLFGYPDSAVDFFVQAGLEGDRTGALVPRDFRRIETVHTFAGNDGEQLPTFVYAVPKGAPEGDDERVLRGRAAEIMSRYRSERSRFIRADSSGAHALWRAWLTTPRTTR